jgi:hypothetical protein
LVFMIFSYNQKPFSLLPAIAPIRKNPDRSIRPHPDEEGLFLRLPDEFAVTDFPIVDAEVKPAFGMGAHPRFVTDFSAIASVIGQRNQDSHAAFPAFRVRRIHDSPPSRDALKIGFGAAVSSDTGFAKTGMLDRCMKKTACRREITFRQAHDLQIHLNDSNGHANRFSRKPAKHKISKMHSF